MELALTGEFISAARAYELGLINRVSEAGEALAGAKDLAASIAANGPLAVAASLQVVAGAQDWRTEEMFAKKEELVTPVYTRADAIAGATAFAEKRAPNWKGK